MNDTIDKRTQNTMDCPQCGEVISKRAIACRHCGALLKDVGQDVTSTLVLARPKGFTDELDAASGAYLQGTSRLNQKALLYISIERVNTPIARYVREEPIVLGRIDVGERSNLHSVNDVDLQPYNARDRGVSRRHAQIFQREGELYIEDIGSSNGTIVNDEPLPRGEARRLHDGDEIMLGRMMVWVNF
ncbi:MAG: FHA domain-containing protein [Chloroflexota bacterium]